MAMNSRPQRSNFRGRYPTSPGRDPAQYRHTTPVVFTEPAPTEDIWDGVGELIKKLNIPSASSAAENVTITDFKTIASYSWKESQEPTILVPGSPLIWRGKRLPFRVPPDQGEVFIDQNAARYPSNPLEPLFRSVETTAPTFDFAQGIDFVADRNSLRKLYSWIVGGKRQDFRIDVDVAGEKTVLLTRWEAQRKETITQFRGFAQEFEKATTDDAPGCAGSTGHHRVVNYRFAGLNMLVRFEVDAYDPKLAPAISLRNKAKSDTSDEDELIAGLLSLKVNSDSTSASLSSTAPTATRTTLRVQRAGTLVPQDSLIKIKTRSQHNVLDWEENWPQFFLSQTPILLVARHSKGSFISEDRYGLNSQEMKGQEKAARKSLGQFALALKEIQASVKKLPAGSKGAVLKCEGGELQVFEKDGSKLSADILGKFKKTRV